MNTKKERQHMIRIAICCGEGFASGFLSRYLAQATVREQLQDQVTFLFIPFPELYERQGEADIAMLMPHIEPMAKNDKRPYSIPMSMITFKVVIKPKAADYLADAEDLLKLADGRGGLIQFPEEERFQFVTRLTSHRDWLASQKPGRK